MDLSVLICTWNNCRLLATTLEEFSKCEIPQALTWEIIVVNNNCTDATDEVVLKWKSRLPIVLVHEPQQGLSRAKNTGLQAAKGKFIIFADDDIKPARDWISVYWNAYQQKPQGYYFGGKTESDFESEHFDHDLLKVAPASVQGYNLGDSAFALEPARYFIGANWACPAEILKQLGGFNLERGLDPSSGKVRSGEETDVMKKLNQQGWQGYYLPQAKILHFVPAKKCTLEHIASRWEAWGDEQVENYKHYLKTHFLILGVPYWMYFVLLQRWGIWFLKKSLGKKAYSEFMAYREYVGLLRGLRHQHVQNENNAHPAMKADLLKNNRS